MELFGVTISRKKVQRPGHTFTDEDRSAAREVRQINQEVKIAKLQAELQKIQTKGKGSLIEQIDEALDLAERFGYGPTEEGEEPGGIGQIMQFVQGLRQQQQQQPGNPQDVCDVPPSPPAAPPSPQPVQLSEQDMVIVMQIEKKIPKQLKKLIKAGAVSPEYFLAICSALWQRLNT